MDRDFREAERAKLPAAARAASILGAMSREYTLADIAIVTRAGPARILGLGDRGHLTPGAVADVVVYEEQADKEAMFARPRHSWKAGQRVLKDGVLVGRPQCDTLVARPRFDGAIERRIDRFMSDHLGLRAHQFRIADGELRGGRGPVPA
jgi:formylmethanofuran dehydrogenase subunit A